MRAYLIITLCTLSACAIENDISRIEDDVNPGTTSDLDENTDNDDDDNPFTGEIEELDQPEDEPIDEEEEEDLDDDGCWFGESTGAFVDTNGDGNVDSMEQVGVKTLPMFELLSPASVTVHPGEEVILDVAITSYHECGDIDFHLFFFGIYDFTDASYEWLKPLNDDQVLSDFEDLDNEEVFPPYAAENMRVTPTGDQLFYAWRDEESIEYYGSIINTQRVEAAGERLFRFTWTASDYAPIGRTFQISLTETGWTDVTTGADIYFDYASLNQGIEIDVTVVE